MSGQDQAISTVTSLPENLKSDAGSLHVVLYGADGTALLTGVAHDAVDSGNPIKIGGKASGSTPANVGESDRVDAWFTPAGALVVAVGSTGDAGSDSRAISSFPNRGSSAGTTATPVAMATYGFNGASFDRLRVPNVFKVVALTAATAETTIWTPAAGKKFRLMGFILTAGAGSTLTFKDNTAGTTIFAARAATDTPISPNGMGNGILSGAADRVLTVTRGTSATLDGVVWGTEE